MSRTKLLLDVVDDLRSLADSIQAVVTAIADDSTEATAAESAASSPSANVGGEKPIPLEQVRAYLGQKSREGYTAEVRELLRKYGADKLSAIDPKDYAALMHDAEVLGDAP